jgi:hypothetical protein
VVPHNSAAARSTKSGRTDIFEVFGRNPDVAEVDAYVRTVMQEALDRLARQRRFPVLG